MLNIVLFGPPGAGKGTQSEKVIAKYALTHLSTGDIFRENIANGTDLGKKVKEYTENGLLVPDSVTIDMLKSAMDGHKAPKGFIFDGFPRTTKQAEALDVLLADKKLSINRMLALEVEKEELISRLLNRGKDSGRADDQNEAIIENRIKVYNNETSPLIEYFKAQNKFSGVFGMGSIDEIFDRLTKVIDNL